MTERVGMDRRTFIKYTGVVAAGAVISNVGRPLTALAVGPDLSGSISGSQSYPGGFVVPAGQTLTFAADADTTVTVGASVIVEGTLRMTPSGSGVTHKLVFEGIDESAFVLGSSAPFPFETDIGLWVVGAGVLDLQGTDKTGWNRTGDDSSWSASDELLVAPTAVGDYDGFKSFTKGGTVPSITNPYGGAGSLGAASFLDTSSSVHKADIDSLAAAGITKGCNPPDNTFFCPSDQVTRGQMAAFLSRAMDLPTASSAGFVDTIGHVFEADIDKLAGAGVTKGCNPPDDTRFCPDDPVTRGQMAAFLARARGLASAASAGFVDTVGHLFETDIDKIAAVGITKGCNPPDNTRFCPDDIVTRGQMASFLVRAFSLPAVTSGDTAYRAEVLNLTRNVQILGQADGRTHVFINSTKPQTIKHALLRYVGPRDFVHENNVAPHFATGRYGLHIHMCEDGSRGTVVEGVVVRDSGNHAFVPHMSHGITFLDCVSYNTYESAYWWDDGKDNQTDDIAWERCLAALVQSTDSGHRLGGFWLQFGTGCSLIDSAAVGVHGQTDASGIHWPEHASTSVWEFHGNVSHNNKRSGIFTWQNDASDHDNFNFTCYRNGAYGINHGAYTNAYHYRDAVLYGNELGAVILKAVNHANAPTDLTFTNVVMDGAGVSDHLITNGDHLTVSPEDAIPSETTFRNCVMTGSGGDKVFLENIAQDISNHPNLFKDRLDFIDCGLTSSDIGFSADADPLALVRVQNGSDAFSVNTDGVSDIPAFD